MRRQKRLRFGQWRIAKAIDIMVAVTLGMGDADQGAECQILLYAEPGLTGQVLASDEEFFAARAPSMVAGMPCSCHTESERPVAKITSSARVTR